MLHLYSPFNHFAFIKGHSIYEFIALSHELTQVEFEIESGSLCLKLDITKAFDKLNWSSPLLSFWASLRI